MTRSRSAPTPSGTADFAPSRTHVALDDGRATVAGRRRDPPARLEQGHGPEHRAIGQPREEVGLLRRRPHSQHGADGTHRRGEERSRVQGPAHLGEHQAHGHHVGP
ncbi:MAG: hypothetical protein WKF43_03295 [Acidimicrobiales bacterium]